jgi:CHAD domain-containing protein
MYATILCAVRCGESCDEWNAIFTTDTLLIKNTTYKAGKANNPSMRAQEATPLLLALAAGRRRRRRDDEQQEQQSSSTLAAATPPRAAQRRSQSPSLAVIHEVGPVHERNSSSSFSYSTPDMYENYNTLSTQVVWPPEGISWPPQGGQFSLTSSSSSSSSSSAASFDIEDSGDAIFRAPSRSSRQLRQIQLLLICTAMVSIPFVAFVSIITPKEHFNSPLDHNNKGRSRDDHTYSYSQRHHRHFHRIVEKSYLTVVNQTDNSSDAAFDINTIPTNISFGELASLMVPIYFQSTVDLCVATIAPSNNNSSDGRNYPTAVMPDEVFVLRKKILKTRDLFDVFAPVYPRKLRLLGHEKKGDGEKKVNMLGGDGGKGKFRSQSEEVLHKMRMNHHTVVDVWKILRRFLDDGYMLIGDFQDLSHAKVKYTPERLQIYQLQVWNWKEEFVAFVAQNHEGIVEYLSHACPDKTEKQEQELTLANIKASSQSRRKGVANKKEKTPSCSYSRSKSSHLFWGRTPSSQLPDGNTDEASTVLAQLGSAQLSRALAYLSPALAAEHVVEDQALNKDVHDLYHNLRKEIRSFLDSVDLFGQLLFPDKSVGQHNEDVSLLKQTKQLLGDLNDEVVAYSKYVEWNEYPEEQVQLESFISADWADFRRWAQEVDLSGKLHSLADAMGNAKNEGPFRE